MKISQQDQLCLLDAALESISYGLYHQHLLPVDFRKYSSAVLQIPHATFVTLKRSGELRGCIGTLTAQRKLIEDVVYNAYAAAFKDPRFDALAESEMENLEIGISILEPETEIDFAGQPSDEETLARLLQPGLDGLILEYRGRRSTFLPSVWESLPEPAIFIRNLKQKAGLPADMWSEQFRFYTYQTFSFTNRLVNA